MVTKLILIFALLAGVMIWLFIVTFRQPYLVPLKGWRFTTTKWVFKSYTNFMLWAHGYTRVDVSYSIDEIDYSKYLGPDWKKNQLKDKNLSI